ncbi:HVO_0234 family beta-propeller protein [Halococcus hamelinensis]|uniref:HVO-0234-like beta-propeller domain-containing protein n=1 Tax=Halococcus hamelinensis 100A6 TaxID=1132509 RepID=M0LRW7_9EURY|nr:hypothetical protein [Halococcus hamelinensis]EMA36221.1 hypothetical protein C447_15651 [Halococcus hamelinensis 100A6]
MSTIDEKRVHAANTDPVALFVATDVGLVRVSVAGERVGEIGLLDRRSARDVATTGETIAVATDEDVLVGEDLDETGFGPATAVGFSDDLFAAAPDGTVARRTDDEWLDCGQLEGIRAIDDDLIAAEDGVYRLADDELSYSGLDDVHDVTGGTPRAATASGLYRLGNGWVNELDGGFEMVAGGPSGVAHAVTETAFYAFDGEWTRVDGVGRRVVDVARGVYAVSADGTLLTATDDGWREHPLGTPGAHAVVARPDRKPV